jgi:hypothetical protein
MAAARPRQKVVTLPAYLPRQGLRGRLEIEHVEIDDPYPNRDLEPGVAQKQLAAKNIAHDVLETEYARGRLSEPEYRAGLIMQRLLERLAENPTGGGRWSEGDRVDVSLSADLKMVRLIDNARKAIALIAEIQPEVGDFGMSVLRRALLGRETFERIALVLMGGGGKCRTFHIAESFRESCRALARLWAAVGKGRRDDSVEVTYAAPTGVGGLRRVPGRG